MSLVIILLLLSCGTLPNPANIATAKKVYGEDIYWEGHYVFFGCTPERGDALTNLFKGIGSILTNKVIPELEASPLPNSYQDPFFVFFSSNKREAIAQVFQAMVDAPKPRPAFICVKEANNDPLLSRAVTECNKGSTRNRTVQASTIVNEDGSIVVLLCPDYFVSYLAFPYVEDCPVVNATDRRYWSTNKSPYISQFSILLHELAHVYLPRPLYHSEESYDLNPLTYLNPESQQINAENYAAFATCKFSIVSEGRRDVFNG